MKRIAALMTLTFGLAATAALAADEVEISDVDGNGTFSYAELVVAYPELTEELFSQIDTDGDGEVNEEEMMTAQGAEVLPK